MQFRFSTYKLDLLDLEMEGALDLEMEGAKSLKIYCLALMGQHYR